MIRWVSRSLPVLAGIVLLAGCAAADAPRPVSAAESLDGAPSPGAVTPRTTGSESIDAGTTDPGAAAPGAATPAAAVTTFPTLAPPVNVPGTTAADPATPAGVRESMVWVPAGDHRVPGTLALPTVPTSSPLPVVLMLHGDLGNRNETGALFARLAAGLAARGVASLRIDFAGSGDAEEPDLALNYPGMVADATDAISYLQADPRLNPARVAVLGMSRGGAVAATLAGTLPLAALVEWSGAVYNGYDEEPDLHDRAREDGYATVGDNPGGFRLSLSWFDTIEHSHPLDDVAGYTGPILAVTGSADQVVPPEVSDEFLRVVASSDTTRYSIDGADHGFDAGGEDQSHAEQLLAITTDWVTSRLAVPPMR